MIARAFVPNSPASARTGSIRPSLALGALIRWLQAPSRDVIVFARRSPSTSPSDQSGPADLRAGLAAWRERVTLLRVRAVARRWLVVAAVPALVLALVDRWLTALPAWFVAVVPLALAALAIGMQSRHRPSLAAIARLADRELALKEQLASGLEVAEGRAGIPHAALNQRLEARAALLLGQARHAWEVRPNPAPREWAGMIALWAAVALLLSLPHAAPASRHPLAGAGTAAVVPATSAPYHVAFPVPTLPPSRGQTSMRLQIAVVETPMPAKAGPKVSRPTHAQRPALSTRPSRPGARPALPSPGAATAGKPGTGRVGSPGGLAPGAPVAPQTRQQAGASGSSVAVYTSRYRTVPPSGNAPAARGQAGKSQGVPPGQSGSRAAPGSQSTSSGNGASRPGTSAANGRAGSNGAPPGSTGFLYTGGKKLLPSQLPKPGLITGKGTFTGKGTPGGPTAGTGRSSGQGRSSSSRSGTQAAQGHQLTLQSAYGARRSAGQTGSNIPGKGGSTTGQTSVSLGSQQGGLHTLDYVLPDTNYVAPSDRALVSHFFVPRSTG